MSLFCFYYILPSGVPISKLNQKKQHWIFDRAPHVHNIEAYKNWACDYWRVHVPSLIQFPKFNVRALHDNLSPPWLLFISSNLMIWSHRLSRNFTSSSISVAKQVNATSYRTAGIAVFRCLVQISDGAPDVTIVVIVGFPQSPKQFPG
jgi:hypothetical protein